VREAFTYMFKDNKFLEKGFIYYIFAFLEMLFALFLQTLSQNRNIQGLLYFSLLGLFITIILIGYRVKCIKALTIQNNNYLLPFFEVGNCIKLGIKAFLAIIFASLVWGLLCIIPFVNIIIILLAFIFFGYFFMAYDWIFSNTEGLNSFLRIKLAWKLIAYAKGNYFKSFIMNIVAAILCEIPAILLYVLLNLSLPHGMSVNIFKTLFMAIFATYQTFISVYIVAKSIKPECLDMLK